MIQRFSGQDTLADYTMDTLLYFFRTRIEAAYEAADYPSGERERSGSNDTYYSQLPVQFTLEDAIALRGGKASYNAVKLMLRNWVKQGLVIRIDRGAYKKLEYDVSPRQDAAAAA